MAKRKHNFNAGPAALPLPVLESVQRDLIDYRGQGLGVMEMSHRSAHYEPIIDGARAALAALYDLPDTHEVLFLQGGASLQFAMVPLNLGPGGAYVNTGVWSTKALGEAKRVGAAQEVWSSAEDGFRHVPQPGDALEVPAGAPYLHYTTNNTIYGTEWHHVPKADVPLVADLSSDFLSRPIDFAPFDLAYAGAQKNAGPAGVTIVIARKSVSRAYNGPPTTANILRYVTHAAKDSMFNTPNTFGIYVVGLVAEWVQQQGGLAAIEQRNVARADRLYAALEQSDRFTPYARADSRSRMNVTFSTGDADEDKRFVAAAAERDMIGLKGHRSVGGLRASIYNAVPDEAVDALIDFIAGW